MFKHKTAHQSQPLLPVPPFEPLDSSSHTLFGVIFSTDSTLLCFVLELLFALVDVSDVFFACGPQGLVSQLFGILQIKPACLSVFGVFGGVSGNSGIIFPSRFLSRFLFFVDFSGGTETTFLLA